MADNPQPTDNMNARRVTFFCALLSALLLFGPGGASALDTFSIGWSTITGGGALRAPSGEFTLSGAVGQFNAGTGGAGEFSFNGGYWTLPPGSGGNADLSGLIISAGALAPSFDPSVTSYTTTVSTDTTAFTVSPFAVEAEATLQVRINGGSYFSVANGGTTAPLALSPGDNIVNVLVTSSNTTGTKLYTLTVTRIPPGTTGEVEALDAGVAGFTVNAILTDQQDRTIIAGSISSVQGTPRAHLARLLASGSLDAGFNPQVSADVYTATVQADGDIVFGGAFTAVNGQARSRLARVKTDGSLDAAFNPAPGGDVLCVVPEGSGRLYIGGAFTTVAGQPRAFLARLNSDGTLDTGFAPAVGAVVYAIAVQPDGKVLAGGNFTTAGGQTRNGIARFNINGTLDPAFDANANSFVATINVLRDGNILLGGNFTSIGGQSRPYLARVSAGGALDTAFLPAPNSTILGTAVQADGRILCAGSFTGVDGQNRGRVARVNRNGTLDTAFAPDANGNVFAVALQPDGKVLLGGEFTTVNGSIRNRFARISNDLPVRPLTVPNTTTVLWSRGGSAPEFTQVTFEIFSGGAWTLLGPGTRAGNSPNWQLSGFNLANTAATIRARGRTAAGYLSGSSSQIEQRVSYNFLTGYALWAYNHIPAGRDAAFNGDWNGDGISNGINYVFGTAVTSFSNSGGVAAPPSVPADVDLYLERSVTLAGGSWTPVAMWVDGAAPSFASGVTLVSGTVFDEFTGPRAYYRYRAAALAAPTYHTDSGGGVTTDLFDIASGTNVIRTTPVLPFGGESIREAFGAVAGIEGGNVIFADGAPVGTTDTVFWQTSGFVNLSRVDLRFSQDGPDPNRSTAAYTLSASSDGVNFTPVSHGTVPLSGGPGTAMVNSPLRITDAALSGMVIGARGFRLDIVRNSTSGPRLVEVDGFGTAGVQSTNYLDPLAFNAASNTHYTGQAGDDQSPGMAVSFSSTPTVAGGADDVKDAFGNNDGPIEPDDVIFADGGAPDNGNAIIGDGGESVDFIAWDTTAPVTLAGFRISLAGDGVLSLRDTELIRFLVNGVAVDLFDNNGADTTVERLFADGPVTGNHFRIEFTRTTNNGPRIFEIDAILGVIPGP